MCKAGLPCKYKTCFPRCLVPTFLEWPGVQLRGGRPTAAVLDTPAATLQRALACRRGCAEEPDPGVVPAPGVPQLLHLYMHLFVSEVGRDLR
eukprot:1147694-Pelagomonas_calceolata.AAC.16